MGYSTFAPSYEENQLIFGALKQNPELVFEHALPIFDISTTNKSLKKLKEGGINYVVCFEDKPGFSKLRYSSFTDEIVHKVAIPYSLSVFRIGKSTRRNPDEFKITEEDLQPDNSWFENFRLRYTRWEEAWWREVLQNSVDTCLEAYDAYNRKGEIECAIYTVEGKQEVYVEVSDNGMGMGKDTLVKAFLTPGGSGKRDVRIGRPVTGGLGKAKEMLFHAWPWWSVWTQRNKEAGLYVEAKYGPYIKGNLLNSEVKPRAEDGTTIRVLMKQDRCVSKVNLVNFISLSEFPIKVTYKKYHQSADGKVTLQEEERLKAENKIEGSDGHSGQVDIKKPNRVLTRNDGSPWAKIYHMPKAKNHKQVIVRAHGLYLFTSPQTIDIKGKVIVELSYRPKGVFWNGSAKDWEIMAPETAARQGIEDYGPLELLTESRDGLLYAYQYQLNDFLNELVKKPEAALKAKRLKHRVRVINKTKNKQKNFEDILEKVDPLELVENTEKSLNDYQQNRLSPEALIKDLANKIVKGELSLSDPDLFQKLKELYTTQQLIIIKNIDVNHLREQVERITGATTQPPPPAYGSGSGWSQDTHGSTTSFYPPRPTPVHQIDYSSLKDAIEQIQPSAVDTSISSDLYLIYKEILPLIIREKRDEGKARNYGEDLLKILEWEPDFIMSDESEDPSPRAPLHFNPSLFEAREKQIAKFWVECTRLCMVLVGRFVPDLETGFLFENPGSDNYLGEFISDSGESENVAEQIGSFKAVLLAPCELSGTWSHRYSLRNYRDIATVTGIAFHEIVHAILNLSEEHKDASHNNIFASLLTSYMSLAMRYSSSFYKLAKYAADKYPIRGSKALQDKIIIEAGKGYYRVKCEKVRGKPPSFATWKEVKTYLEQHVSEGKDCEVTFYYWPKYVTESEIGGIEHRVKARMSIYSLADLERKIKNKIDTFIIDDSTLTRDEIWRKKRKY